MSTMTGSKWKSCTLGECCEIVSGSTPKREQATFWNGDIPWVTPKDLSGLDSPDLNEANEFISREGYESCSTQILPKGAVLFSSRAPIVLIAIAGKPMCTNQGFKSLIPKSGLDSRYLYYCLKQMVPQIQSLGNGATFKEVSKETMSRVEIPLPPLPEQKRIADILDKADAIRRKRREATQQSMSMFESCLETALERLGTTSAPMVPLEDICWKITDGTHLPPKFKASGIPFIFVKNIVNARISFRTEKYIDEQTYQELTKRTPIELGDVLYTTVGVTYGQAALVDTTEPFAFQRHIAHLKPDASKVRPEYLAAVMNIPRTKQQADRWARGAAQPTLNLKELRLMTVPLPSIEWQDKLVSLKRRCDRLEHCGNSAALQMEALFSSLVQQAFRGEL